MVTVATLPGARGALPFPPTPSVRTARSTVDPEAQLRTHDLRARLRAAFGALCSTPGAGRVAVHRASP